MRVEDISSVKHMLLQHLPIFHPAPSDDSSNKGKHDQHVSSIYLDNTDLSLYHSCLQGEGGEGMTVRLKWYGTREPERVYCEKKTHREGRRELQRACAAGVRRIIFYL